MSNYQVIICDRYGTAYGNGEVATATPTRITWELNAPESATISVPLADAEPFRVLAREVQIWRNFQLIFWGVPTRVRMDDKTAEFQCQGLLWYFTKRFVGRAGRQNILGNPDFEAALLSANHPDPRGSWSPYGVSAWIDTNPSRHILGNSGLNLWQLNWGVDTFARQLVTPPWLATYYVFAGWFFIPADQGWQGPAYNSRGLFISVVHTPDLRPVDHQFIPITDDTPRGQWQRVKIGITVPNDPNHFLDLRLYAPGQSGTGAGGASSICWDACELVVMESLSCLRMDQATIAASLVQHAQNLGLGKSDLNIGVDCPPTGQIRDRVYQYADHQNIGDMLDELHNLDGGVDIGVEYTRTTRTFRTYYPSRGTVRNDLALELGRNITEFSYDLDGENTVTSLVYMGDGEGPDREEASAIDSGGLGGLILEDVVAAPAGTPIDWLQANANAQLNKKKNIATILTITTADPSVIGNLHPGDIIPARISMYWFGVSGSFRVIKMDTDPQKETTSITANPA